MVTKLFHHKSSTISSAALVIAGFTVLGAGLGIIRNAFLASKFGAGAALDVYYASFRIPDFMYGIFYLGVVSVLFLPIFNDLFVKDKEKAWKFFGAMVSWITIILGVFALVLVFAAPVIIRWIVPGFEQEQIDIVVQLTRLMLIQPVILGISNIISGALQSFDRFAAASLGHVFYNFGIIIGIIFFVPLVGIHGLAWGVVLGAVLHLLVQLPSFYQIKRGFTISFMPDFEIVRPHIHLILPRIFNVISNQINLFVITILASTAAVGSLAVFTLANDIQALPQTAIAISLAIAAFPTISRLAFHNREKFAYVLHDVIRKIVFFLVPISFFMIVFRAQIVRLILGYGAFGWEDTVLTLNTLMIFSVGILFQGLIPFFVRAFFALHNTKIPLVAALIGNVITLVFGISLLPAYGVVGLAIALVVANIVHAGILYGVLVQKKLIQLKWLVQRGTLIVLVSALGATSGWFFLRVFDKVFDTHRVLGLGLQTVFSGVGALLVLALLFKVFRIEEFEDFLAGVRKKFSQ